MNYRPLTDVWILARPKVKFYGAYPAGFLHRARHLLGIGAGEAVLHVCSGKVKDYPYRGFGVWDKTLDLDPALNPDYLQDANEPFPYDERQLTGYWGAVLIDRPYTPDDADKYVPGRDLLPPANLLVKHAIAVVPVGGKVGILDYIWPQPPKNALEVAVVAVGVGRNSRARWFCVFERTS